MKNSRQIATVTACALVSAVLGTIHAFSVFIPQWEQSLRADRAAISFVYSLALVSLTVAVLYGYRVYRLLSPPVVFALVGVCASLGLVVSARIHSLSALYLSYGILFGAANGLGYGYALQLAGQALVKKRALAMCLITAFYAVGATLSPHVFVWLIDFGGNSRALIVMSAIVLGVSLLSAAIVFFAKARFEVEPAASIQSLTPELNRARRWLWLGYGSAVAAGLMVIGHAFGIAEWMGLDSNNATWVTTSIAFCNMLGGFIVGYYAGRIPSRSLLLWLPLFSAIGLLLLVVSPESSWLVVLISLGLVGGCYGAIIAIYPVAVAEAFGTLAAPRIYGQVFTAWGAAGLLGPWVSGWIFDQTGSYTIPLLLAGLLSAGSVFVVRFLLAR